MPKKIVWWNTQRFGAGTDIARRNGLEAMSGQWNLPDLLLFCELTALSKFPQALNLTYRRQTNRQLCYGVVKTADPQPNPVKFLPVVTPAYRGAMYNQQAFRGGGDFRRLVNRAPGWMNFDGIAIYFFHAPAHRDAAARAVTFLVSSLVQTHGNNPWILVGDLNVEPETLREVENFNLGQFIREPNGPTYWTRGGRGKILDYALSNFPLSVRVGQGGERLFSDHAPILLTIP